MPTPFRTAWLGQKAKGMQTPSELIPLVGTVRHIWKIGKIIQGAANISLTTTLLSLKLFLYNIGYTIAKNFSKVMTTMPYADVTSIAQSGAVEYNTPQRSSAPTFFMVNLVPSLLSKAARQRRVAAKASMTL